MSDSVAVVYAEADANARTEIGAALAQRERVLAVASAREALDELARDEARIVFVGERLEDASALELLTRVEQLHPNVVRIAVTNGRRRESLLRALHLGLVTRYLEWPCRAGELEEALRLAREVARLAEQNAAVQRRLANGERRMTLGRVASAIMHDLHQPLAYLLTNSERLLQLAGAAGGLRDLVLRHGGELLPETRRDLLALAEELPEIVPDLVHGCRVMREQCAGVREVLRPDATPGRATTNPITVVRYALGACRELASFGVANLRYEGPDALPKVAISPGGLTQVLIEVIANAAQAVARHNAPGGTVTVTAEEHESTLTFAVRDNGPGMAKDVLDRAGTLFFSTRDDGAGVGLHQCRLVVERAGGTLTLASQLGEGTTVRITLARA